MSGTAANASGEKSSSNYEVSDECEDDDNYGSRPNENYESYKSLSSLQSRSIQKSSNSSSEGRSGKEGDDDKGCASKRVPKTIKNLLLASCSADATLTWVAPIARGYLPNDNYQIRYSSDGGITWIIYGTQTSATSITLTGLTAGLTYIFQVQAHNANGWSKWSKSTGGCQITGGLTTYDFTLSGLDQLPIYSPLTCPEFYTDYLPVPTSFDAEHHYICATTPASGTFIKGTFSHDLYVSLPARVSAYSLTVTGGSCTSLGAATNLITGNYPTIFNDVQSIYVNYVVYGCTFTTGPVLGITIN